MSAARHLQRAMERGTIGDMCAVDGPLWTLSASLEALAPDDDTMGTDELPAFLDTYERDARAGVF